jgi:hypothetical protein
MLENLKQVKRHLSDADIAYLIKSLEEARKKAESGG